MTPVRILLFMMLLFSVVSYGQVPRKLSYQGVLTDSSGAPVTDGSYNLKFEVYSASSGGSSLSTMTVNGVSLQRGRFSLLLDTLPASFNAQLYVQVTALAGPGIGSPLVFSPRSVLTSAPYAFRADTAGYAASAGSIGGVAGGDLTGSYPNPTISNNSISGTKLLSDSSSLNRVSGGMMTSTGGKIGVGTTNPISALHVKGNSPLRIMGDVATLAGSEYVDFMARNSPYSTDIGGMRVQRDSVSGDVNLSLYAAKSGFSASEKMRVGGNGNVGIGTTSPAYKLHIYGAQEGISIQGLSTIPYNTAYMSFRNGSGARIGYVGDGSTADNDVFLNSDSGNVNLSTSAGRVLTAASNGNVGIGTTSPSYRLHVYSTAYGDEAVIQNNGATDAWGLNVFTQGSGGGTHTGVYSLADNATQNTGVYGEADWGTNDYGVWGYAHGGSGSNYAGYFGGNLVYTGSLIGPSDEKLKENIQPYTGALTQIMNLKPKTFTFKTSPEYDRFSFSPGKHYGFLAQEIEKVFPELVVTAVHPSRKSAPGIPAEKPFEYKAIKPLEMIPIMVQAIQEQQKLIEQLQARIDQLEKK